MNKIIIYVVMICMLSFSVFGVDDEDLRSGTQAYYTLDETSGTNGEDSAGSNDGNASNSRIFTSNTETSGIINSGADFTQGDDRISLPSILFSSGTESSISLWFSSSSSGVLYSEGDVNEDKNYILIDYGIEGGSNNLRLVINDDSGSSDSISTSVPNDEYTNVQVERNNNDYTLYINGQEEEILNSNRDPKNDLNTANIGVLERTSLVSYYSGFIDEVAIWNETKNKNEIEELYDRQSQDLIGSQYDFTSSDVTSISNSKESVTNTSITINTLINNSQSEYDVDYYIKNSSQNFNNVDTITQDRNSTYTYENLNPNTTYQIKTSTQGVNSSVINVSTLSNEKQSETTQIFEVDLEDDFTIFLLLLSIVIATTLLIVYGYNLVSSSIILIVGFILLFNSFNPIISVIIVSLGILSLFG